LATPTGCSNSGPQGDFGGEGGGNAQAILAPSRDVGDHAMAMSAASSADGRVEASGRHALCEVGADRAAAAIGGGGSFAVHGGVVGKGGGAGTRGVDGLGSTPLAPVEMVIETRDPKRRKRCPARHNPNSTTRVSVSAPSPSLNLSIFGAEGGGVAGCERVHDEHRILEQDTGVQSCGNAQFFEATADATAMFGETVVSPIPGLNVFSDISESVLQDPQVLLLLEDPDGLEDLFSGDIELSWLIEPLTHHINAKLAGGGGGGIELSTPSGQTRTAVTPSSTPTQTAMTPTRTRTQETGAVSSMESSAGDGNMSSTSHKAGQGGSSGGCHIGYAHSQKGAGGEEGGVREGGGVTQHESSSMSTSDGKMADNVSSRKEHVTSRNSDCGEVGWASGGAVTRSRGATGCGGERTSQTSPQVVMCDAGIVSSRQKHDKGVAIVSISIPDVSARGSAHVAAPDDTVGSSSNCAVFSAVCEVSQSITSNGAAAVEGGGVGKSMYCSERPKPNVPLNYDLDSFLRNLHASEQSV